MSDKTDMTDGPREGGKSFLRQVLAQGTSGRQSPFALAAKPGDGPPTIYDEAKAVVDAMTPAEVADAVDGWEGFTVGDTILGREVREHGILILGEGVVEAKSDDEVCLRVKGDRLFMLERHSKLERQWWKLLALVFLCALLTGCKTFALSGFAVGYDAEGQTWSVAGQMKPKPVAAGKEIVAP